MNIRARRYRERSYCMVKVCILHIHRVHVMVHSEFEYIAVFKRVSRSTNAVSTFAALLEGQRTRKALTAYRHRAKCL